MLDKQSKNLGTGGTIPRKMVVNIKYGACMQQHLFEYFSEEETERWNGDWTLKTMPFALFLLLDLNGL